MRDLELRTERAVGVPNCPFAHLNRRVRAIEHFSWVQLACAAGRDGSTGRFGAFQVLDRASAAPMDGVWTLRHAVWHRRCKTRVRAAAADRRAVPHPGGRCRTRRRCRTRAGSAAPGRRFRARIRGVTPKPAVHTGAGAGSMHDFPPGLQRTLWASRPSARSWMRRWARGMGWAARSSIGTRAHGSSQWIRPATRNSHG